MSSCQLIGPFGFPPPEPFTGSHLWSRYRVSTNASSNWNFENKKQKQQEVREKKIFTKKYTLYIR